MGSARAPPRASRGFLHARGKGRTSWHPVPPLLFLIREGSMLLILRSFGGKLILVTALTLLLCMLLFTVASWGLFTFYSEHTAKSDAAGHLELMNKAYQANTALLIHVMEMLSSHNLYVAIPPHSI